LDDHLTELEIDEKNDEGESRDGDTAENESGGDPTEPFALNKIEDKKYFLFYYFQI
jgi:hypothetical protein